VFSWTTSATRIRGWRACRRLEQISAGLFKRETLCHDLAEFTLQSLPGRADRERFHDFEPFGQLERGNLLRAEVRNEIVEGYRRARLEDHGRIFKYQGMEIRITYSGRVTSADEIKFTRQVAEFATEEVVAKRVK